MINIRFRQNICKFSFIKQIIQHNLTAYKTTVFIIFHPICCDHMVTIPPVDIHGAPINVQDEIENVQVIGSDYTR